MTRVAFGCAVMIGVAFGALAEDSHQEALEKIKTFDRLLKTFGLDAPKLKNEKIPAFDISVTAVGSQWNWSFRYETEDGSVVEPPSDGPLVVPINQVIKLKVTSEDVLHGFSIPAFGISVDAIPGRFETAWFKAKKIGIYLGQCSELCGRGHAEMVVKVRVVSGREFERWLEEQWQ